MVSWAAPMDAQSMDLAVESSGKRVIRGTHWLETESAIDSRVGSEAPWA